MCLTKSSQILIFCVNYAVKVLVFLTMPIDPASKDIPQQIEYLWDLKSLITYSDAIPVIVTLLVSPLEHLEGYVRFCLQLHFIYVM